MSIYGLLHQLTLYDHQAAPHTIHILSVPPHLDSPDWDYLPPPVDPKGRLFRAVLIVEANEPKGTSRSSQEYGNPLLLLTGQEYHDIRFADLLFRIHEAIEQKHGAPEWKATFTREELRWYID